MAQHSRALAAVLERRFRHDHPGLDPRLAAQFRAVAGRHLVRQRPAGGGPLVFPAGCRTLHADAPVPCLVPDLRCLDGLAVVTGRAVVVQGHAAGQFAAGGGDDTQGQFPPASPWQVVERGRGATALCAAGAWAVLSGQVDHRHRSRDADRSCRLSWRDHSDIPGRGRDGDHADRLVHDGHGTPPARETHRPAGRP
ncbi:hypothetical protein D3C81_1652660 [compost metagenome]